MLTCMLHRQQRNFDRSRPLAVRARETAPDNIVQLVAVDDVAWHHSHETLQRVLRKTCHAIHV